MVRSGKGGCSCDEGFVIVIIAHRIKGIGRGGDGWGKSKDHVVLPRLRGHKLPWPCTTTRYLTPGELFRRVEDAAVLDTPVRRWRSFALRCSPVRTVYAKMLVI